MRCDQPDPDSKKLLQEKLQQQDQTSRQQAFRFIITQLFITLVLSVLMLFFSRVVAYSSLVGGLIATLANAWFAIKVFRVKPTQDATTVLATFYVGEIFKFILTGAMFIMAFVLIKPLSVVALLITYFLIHMTPAVQNAFGKNGQTAVTDSEKR